MPAVVCPEDDDRVVGILAVVQRLEEPADETVGVRDGSQIPLDGSMPLFVLQHIRVVAFGVRHPNAGLWNIIQIVLDGLREPDVVDGKLVEVLRRHIPGQVWPENPACQEEGLAEIAIQLFGNPINDLCVAHFGIIDFDRPPVEVSSLGNPVQWAIRWQRIARPCFRLRWVVLVPRRRVRELAVVDFSRPHGRVSMRHEMLRQGDGVRHGFAPRVRVLVHAGRGGANARHQGGTRWIAGGRSTVSVREQDATFCQPIDVRRYRLRVTAEYSDPVVEIINGDEQHVRFLGDGSGRDARAGTPGHQKRQQDAKTHQHSPRLNHHLYRKRSELEC